MTSLDWAHDDDALEAMIKQALSADKTRIIPADTRDSMLRAAKSAYIWRTVDDELEHLSIASDTALEASVRSSSRSRIVRFQGENVSLELEISDGFIVGQVYPTQSGLVTLTPLSGPAVEISTDNLGCFTTDSPIDGPFRVRCDTPNSSVMTDWMS